VISIAWGIGFAYLSDWRLNKSLRAGVSLRCGMLHAVLMVTWVLLSVILATTW
jgi:hypothetical protein